MQIVEKNMKVIKDYTLHYNFVYFNENYNSKWVRDPDEYNAICLRDVEKMKDVKVLQVPLQDYPLFLRILYCIYNSSRVQKYIKLPRRILFPFIFKNIFKNSKPFCFVFATASYPIEYIEYLRKRYSGCKIVMIHRDLVKITHLYPKYTEENMNRLFDKRYSYDQREANQYGLSLFTGILSKIDIKTSSYYPISDVFFAGKAKERLHKIIEAYDIFEKAGLKCDFYITHVPEKDKVLRKGITYSDHLMPYNEILYKSINSKCMLEISQEGAIGYTSRFFEAVIYNKLFITDNPTIKSTVYYKTGCMLYYSSISEIDPNFVAAPRTVNYNYKGEFSPINLILQIDKDLSI